MEERLLFRNNQITTATFSNIFMVSCLQKEFVWAEEFAKQYGIYLPENVRSDELIYCQAIGSFYQKNFEAVVHQFAEYSFSHQYALKTRNLLIRTYFELFLQNWDYYEILENNLLSFENFLYKNETYSLQLKAPYLNLIQILKTLIPKIMGQTPKKNLNDWLKQKLAKKQGIVSKNWLESRFFGANEDMNELISQQ